MDDTWYNITIMFLFLIFGSVLNLVIFVLAVFTRSFQTINNKFISHIAAVSFIGSSTLFSIFLVQLMSSSSDSSISFNNLCLVEHVIGQFCLSTTALLLLIFGFYRFMSTIRPLTILVYVRIKTTNLLLIVPWIAAGILTVLCTVFEGSGSCILNDWTHTTKYIFVVYLCISAVVPVASLIGFFVAILVKSIKNKKTSTEMQLYHESQIGKSITSQQSQGHLAIKNPTFQPGQDLVKRWSGQSNIPKLVQQAEKYENNKSRSTSSNSVNNNSIYKNFDERHSGYNEDLDVNFTGISEIVDRNSEVANDGIATPESSSQSTLDTPSTMNKLDPDIDFITSQNEDFFQDMMDALQKSFRESKEDERASNQSASSDYSISSNDLRQQQQFANSHKNMAGEVNEGMDSTTDDGEGKSFDFDGPEMEYYKRCHKFDEQNVSTTPSTPEFYPSTPPYSSSSSDDASLFRESTPKQSIVAASLNGKEPSETEYPEGKVVFLNRDSQLEYPRSTAFYSSSADDSTMGRGFDAESHRPSHPIPGHKPLDSSADVHGSSEDPFDSFENLHHNSEVSEERIIRDKWLLDKLLSIDKRKEASLQESKQLPSNLPPFAQDTPPKNVQQKQDSLFLLKCSEILPQHQTKPLPQGNPALFLQQSPLTLAQKSFDSPVQSVSRQHPSLPPLVTLASLQKKQNSEGYSATLLLLLYCITFLLLQVQYLMVLLHRVLTKESPSQDLTTSNNATTSKNTTTSATFLTEISYSLHLIFYVLTSLITITVCKPVRDAAVRYLVLIRDMLTVGYRR